MHGTGMNKAIWTYYVDELVKIAKKDNSNFELNTVIAFDAVSHCDSAIANKGKLGADYIWADGAKDLIEIIKHESRVDSRFKDASNIAIGHSLGGHGVLMAGFFEPLLFDSIVTIEPVIFPMKRGTLEQGIKLFETLSAIIKTKFKTDEEFMDYMRKKSFYKKFHPKIFGDFTNDEKLVTSNSVEAKTSKLSQMATYIASAQSIPIGWENLKFIFVPVLHIVGKDASWNPPGSAQKITDRIPDCKMVEIPEGTHLLHLEIPDAVIERIVDFIQERSDKEQRPSQVSSKAFKDPNHKFLIDRWVKSSSKL